MAKKALLLAGLLALLVTPFVFAEVDPEGTDPQAENVKALESVTVDNYYKIFTYSDGSAITGTKFYLKTDGYLTDNANDAGMFPLKTVSRTINLETGNIDVTAFKFDARFTNPTLDGSNGQGNLVANGHINVGNNNRDDFEAQVFFLGKSGNYAIRATAANSANWGANTYWTATDTNADGMPEAEYSLTPAYIWQLEDATTNAYRTELQALIDEVQNIVDNRIGVGDGPFLKSEDNLSTLATYLESAKTIANKPDATDSQLQAAHSGLSGAYDEFKAAGNAPKADTKYIIVQKASGLYMAFSATESRVVITDTPTELTWEAAADGGWYLTDGTKYVGLAGNNVWTMSSDPENKVALNPQPVQVNGTIYYTFGEPNGLIATDNTTSGSYCYADKSVAKSGDKAYWSIVENNSAALLSKAIAEAEAAIGETGGLFQHTDEAAAILMNTIIEAKSYEHLSELNEAMVEQLINALAASVQVYLESPVGLPESTQPYTIQLNGTNLYMNISEGAFVEETASNLFFEMVGDNLFYLKDAYGHYISLTPGENPDDNWSMSNVADQKVALSFEYADGAYHIKTPSGYIAMDGYDAGERFWADKAKGKDTWLIAKGQEEVIQEEYTFVASEWQAGDPVRISPSNVVVDAEANTITVNATGTNNVALNFKTEKNYIVPAAMKYFAIKATGLSTAENQSYLWWLNAKNVGSQVPPTAIYEENGETVFAWDMQASGIGGTLGLEDTELNKDGADTWGWTTTFGMTLADQSVPAVISYIGFMESLPEPTPEPLEQSLDVEYYKGQNGLNYTVDFTEGLAFLGIESIDQATIVGVNVTTDEEVANYLDYDGWRNKSGDYTYWSDAASAVCVKFANEGEKYAIYDRGNDNVPAVGETFKAKFAVKANDKTVFYTINVKFIEKPQAEYTFDQLNKLITLDINVESECGKFFEGLTANMGINVIIRNLDVASMDEVTIYAVQSNNSMDPDYKLGGACDGWRDEKGDWHAYPGAFYVKTDFDRSDNQFYEIGGMQGGTEEPATYTATFAFVKNGTKDAVVVRVNLIYTKEDGIAGINAETKSNVIFDLSGRRVQKAQKGVFIVNGKKVAVK